MASKDKRDFSQKSKNNHSRQRSNRRGNNYTTKGKDEQVMDKKPGGNDPRWWGSSDYVKSVSQFNFASPLGKLVPYDFQNDPLSTTQFSMAPAAQCLKTVPGVMAIDVLPSVGIARSAPDAMNTYLRSVYSKLRSTNNQSAPYQAPDLGMYIMAIDSVHMLIEQLTRMYGVARTYSAMNRYLPVAMLSAMGIDPMNATYNIFANLADFRAEILNLMIKIQTLAVPKGISINERHRELVHYVYKDGESVKSQSYLFRTPYLYKYNETYSSSGGGLEATAVPIGSGVHQWISLAHTLIDQLTQSQDFAIISGDIIKSFGYENLFSMPYFDEMYTVVPVYNPEILLEIHNMKLCGDRWNATAFDITQDAGTNSFICAPYCGTSELPTGPVFPIIDVPVDSPDPDLVMVATRLAVVGTTSYDAGTSKYKFVPSMIGTEMPIRITMYYYDGVGTLKTVSTETNNVAITGVNYLIWEAESFFDWHPHMYHVTLGTGGATDLQLHTIMSELQNYTVMAPGDLSKLHEMAVYGALTCINIDNVGLK